MSTVSKIMSTHWGEIMVEKSNIFIFMLMPGQNIFEDHG